MRILIISCILLSILSCENKSKKNFRPSLVSIKGKTMGTYYSIKLDEVGVDKVSLKKDVDELLLKLNQVFSTYLKTSELSSLNQLKQETKVKLSSEMNEVITLAKKMHFETNGAFDPTIGPVVNRWGFGPDKDKNRPTKEEIKKIMIDVGVNNFQVNEGYFYKKSPRVYIDLSAIAKGYAVDKVTEYLRKTKGYRNVLVEIGGEVRGHGHKHQSVWAIGIESPQGQLAAGIQKVVPLLNRSMATSGSYRNYLKYGDQVFSHTIDPTTGAPVKHKLVSVTVIHSDCVYADAYATSLMVMGPEKGFDYAQSKGLLAYFLVKDKGELKELSTKAFNTYMNAFQKGKK